MNIIREAAINPQRTTGASRRTEQIKQILRSAGADIIDVYRPYESNVATNIKRGLKYTKSFQPSPTLKLKHLKRLGFQGQFFEQAFDKYHDIKAICWEHTTFHTSLVFAKKHNIPIIAFPHNIESLTTAKQSSTYMNGVIHDDLKSEIELYSLCDQVYTISKYDSWLLAQFGVQSTYLPYYPADDIANELLAVRTKRSQNTSKKLELFIPGSAFYKPIFDGMLAILKVLENITKQQNITINVAGHGSEALQAHFDNPNIVIHGSVSDKKFRALQTQCTACIAYQDVGTGAMTRIPEMLIAGIPVIANTLAARSYEGTQGIYTFEHGIELLDILASDVNVMPPPYTNNAKFGQQHLKGFLAKYIYP